MCRRGAHEKKSNIPCASALTWTDLLAPWPPRPSPPTACSLCLSQSFYLYLSPFPFSPPKFNLVFARDGEELGGFMPGTVEYIKLLKKIEINEWRDLSVLVSPHWMSIIWASTQFYLLIYFSFLPTDGNAVFSTVLLLSVELDWLKLVWKVMMEGKPNIHFALPS